MDLRNFSGSVAPIVRLLMATSCAKKETGSLKKAGRKCYVNSSHQRDLERKMNPFRLLYGSTPQITTTTAPLSQFRILPLRGPTTNPTGKILIRSRRSSSLNSLIIWSQNRWLPCSTGSTLTKLKLWKSRTKITWIWLISISSIITTNSLGSKLMLCKFYSAICSQTSSTGVRTMHVLDSQSVIKINVNWGLKKWPLSCIHQRSVLVASSKTVSN